VFDTVDNHWVTVSFGGRPVTKRQFADNINGVTELELESTITKLKEIPAVYGIEIST